MVYAAFYVPYSIRSGSTSHPLRSAEPDAELWAAAVHDTGWKTREGTSL